MEPSRDIERLIAIMAALRHPETGCPWDLKQDFASIAPYTIEEAYEVADAIERSDLADLKDELGDLLLQVAYHARLAEELGAFSFGDVVEAITAKMICRHPHVFGDAAARAAGLPEGAWDRMKEEERAEKGDVTGEGVLDGVPVNLPALTRAVKLQKRAARVGFDWAETAPVVAKLREEIDEVVAEIDSGGDADRIEDEIGDVLFAAANLARHLKVDPERALRRSNAKFMRRFRAVEGALASAGRPIAKATLDEMEAAWDAAKAAERDAIPPR
ncbi:MAG: nucleoside triphosphate pyrophosphohydrolase [Bauldia sp.]|nr:nucleoside triphosphate pyrophosphohydrolase [Bauldia sp.]